MVRVIAFCILFLGSAAEAQLSSSMELEAQKAKKKRFQAIALVSSESNFQDSESPDARSTSSFVLVPTYKLSEFNTLGATVAYIQDHDDEQKSQMNNMKLYIKKKPITLMKKGTLSFVQYFSGYLPTNQDSREIGSFQGAVEYDPRLVFTLNPSGLSLPLTYRLRLRKNFHEFSLSEKATANISHSVSNSLNMERPMFGTPVALGLDFGITNAWTYRGTPRSQFSASQYLSYAINNKTILQLGHSNTDSYYKSDGRTNNVEVFDQVSSMYYGTMILIF